MNAVPTWPINSAVRRWGSRIMATIATTIIKATVSTARRAAAIRPPPFLGASPGDVGSDSRWVEVAHSVLAPPSTLGSRSPRTSGVDSAPD
jgi:hypothetical protein